MEDYKTLRLISTVTIGFGWGFVLIGWIVAVLVAVFTINIMQNFFDYPPLTYSVLMLAIVIVLGGIASVGGLFVIGAGQVYLVLLDIRNDVRELLRQVKHGMIKLEEN